MIEPTQSSSTIKEALVTGMKTGKSVVYHIPTGHFYAVPNHQTPTLGPEYITQIHVIASLVSSLKLPLEERTEIAQALKERAQHLEKKLSPSSDLERMIERLKSAAAQVVVKESNVKEREAALKDQLLFWMEEVLQCHAQVLPEELTRKGIVCLEKLEDLYPNHPSLRALKKGLDSREDIRPLLYSDPLFKESLSVIKQIDQLKANIKEMMQEFLSLPDEILSPLVLTDAIRALSEPLEQIRFKGEQLEEDQILIYEKVVEEFVAAHKELSQLAAKRLLLDDSHSPLPTIKEITEICAR